MVIYMRESGFVYKSGFGRRMFLMIFGVIVQGMGLSLLLKINLGVDPYTCFTTGMVNHIPIGFGTVQFLGHLINFLIVIKFDLKKIG